MRVLFLTPGFPSAADPVSGNFVKRIGECLTAEGVSVTVINPVARIPLPAGLLPQHLQVRRELPEFEQTAAGIDVHRPRYFSYPKSTVWGVAHQFILRAVQKTFQQHQLKFDVLHGQWLYPMGYVAVKLGQQLGLPVCNTMRGDDITTFPSTRLGRSRISYVLRESDVLTSVSRTLARQAQQLVNVPIEFIANGAVLESTTAEERRQHRSAFRRALGLADDMFYVLFVGAITPAKGLQELIQSALALSSDKVKFLAIGYRLAGDREHPLPEPIQFLGSQSHERVMKYMRCCDVLAFPSHREGMPNVVVEAASVGLPVVATDVGGVAELIDETTGIRIPPASGVELTSALARVIADYPAALQRAERARQRVLADYDMQANARKLKRVYSDLLDGRRGRAN